MATQASILRGVSNKDTKSVLRKLVKDGWTMRLTKSNHVVLTDPFDGRKIVVPMTAGNRNAGKLLARNTRRHHP